MRLLPYDEVAPKHVAFFHKNTPHWVQLLNRDCGTRLDSGRQSLVENGYWNQSYEFETFKKPPADSKVRKWIEQHINKRDGECIEIGCYPGTYLSVLGDLGYTLNGLDLIPETDGKLPNWLHQQGYSIGKFRIADFQNYEPDRTYDLVCSFGFIEHFRNWQDILLKHAALVKPGGRLLISAPNFRGPIQRSIHLLFNKENLNRHNLHAMIPTQWATILEREGFRAVFCGYFGGFHFWVDSKERNILATAALKLLMLLTPFFRKIAKNSSWYSPFCGIIADRTP